MGKLWLPDPRMEMPELFEPGRKPVGPVEIDRNHWAGKYTTFALVHDWTDIVSGERVPDNAGRIKEGSIFIDTPSADSKTKDVPLPGLRKYGASGSFVIVLKPSGLINFAADMANILRVGSVLGRNNLWVFWEKWSSAKCFTFQVRGNYGGTYNLKVPFTTIDQSDLDRETVLVGSVTVNSSSGVNDGRAEFYQDGEARGSVSSASIIPFDSTEYDALYLGNTIGGYTGLPGLVKLVAFFDKSMTAEDARRLHRNPYQFITPA